MLLAGVRLFSFKEFGYEVSLLSDGTKAAAATLITITTRPSKEQLRWDVLTTQESNGQVAAPPVQLHLAFSSHRLGPRVDALEVSTTETVP